LGIILQCSRSRMFKNDYLGLTKDRKTKLDRILYQTSDKLICQLCEFGSRLKARASLIISFIIQQTSDNKTFKQFQRKKPKRKILSYSIIFFPHHQKTLFFVHQTKKGENGDRETFQSFFLSRFIFL